MWNMLQFLWATWLQLQGWIAPPLTFLDSSLGKVGSDEQCVMREFFWSSFWRFPGKAQKHQASVNYVVSTTSAKITPIAFNIVQIVSCPLHSNFFIACLQILDFNKCNNKNCLNFNFPTFIDFNFVPFLINAFSWLHNAPFPLCISGIFQNLIWAAVLASLLQKLFPKRKIFTDLLQNADDSFGPLKHAKWLHPSLKCAWFSNFSLKKKHATNTN